MEKEKIDLSIVILSYNSKADLARLLPSVFGSETKYSYEVIVVDNGSSDGTPDWLISLFDGRQKVILIRNQNNGFAHGNNLGIRQAQGKYILILNPDTEFKPDTLQIMLEFMENHSDVGISTCKVVLPDGKLDLACRRRFPNPWNSFLRLIGLSATEYNMLDTDEDQSMEIDSCMGAFMMVRREALEKINNLSPALPKLGEGANIEKAFDEAFFMYGEDLDLCWRAKESGYKVWYYPNTSITHYKGSASLKTPFKALRWFHEAMWIFYKKHYKNSYPFILNWLVWLGIKLRLWALIVINFSRSEKFVSKR